MKAKLQIRDIFKETGLDRETLRFYEQKGLLPKPDRTQAGYRQFDAEVISRIKFIKLAQDVGFSLKEILELLNLGQKKVISKTDLRGIVEKKISQLDARIKSLKSMKKVLVGLSKIATQVTKGAECPILSQFKNLEL
jgi:DNA-binding transcriptional MerR regulator